MTIFSSGSWHAGWSLHEVNIQYLGTESLSQVKQSTGWVECSRSEGLIGKLKSHIAEIAMNVWGYDLLQESKINILLIS